MDLGNNFEITFVVSRKADSLPLLFSEGMLRSTCTGAVLTQKGRCKKEHTINSFYFLIPRDK